MVLENDQKIYISPIFLVLKQIQKRYFALNPDTRKAQWKSINDRSKFRKKYFANVEKILCKLWKNTLHWTWTREKPNGKTLVLEANFEQNTLQMLKKYFANVGNFGKKLCIEPGHEKSPMEKHYVRSKSRLWLRSRKQFLFV